MLNTETESHLGEVVNQNAVICENSIKSDLTTLRAIAEFIGTYDDIHDSVILQSMRAEVQKNAFARMGIISKDGQMETTDLLSFSVAEQDYFQEAAQGKEAIDTILSTYSNKKIIVYAVPVYKGGEITAVLQASRSTDNMEQIFDLTSFGGKGYSYIVNQRGELVIGGCSPNRPLMQEKLFGREGVFQDNAALAGELKTNFALREDGITRVRAGGEESFFAYAPISGDNGWFVISVIPASVVFDKANRVIALTLSASVALLLIFIAIILYIVRTKNLNRSKIEKLAYEDSLIGCRNIVKFELDYRRLMNDRAGPAALVQLDIVRFKYINDIFGFKEGDQVLLQVARVLRHSLGQREMFCRSSGDHFLLFMEYQSQQRLLSRLRQVAREIEQFHSSMYRIVLAFGIYPVTDPALSFNAMADRANIARISNKQQHETTFTFYDEALRNQIISEKEIEDEMAAALVNGEFKVYLQPKYAIQDRPQIAGAEALVRWVHPAKGLIPPDSFIPLFEENRFILKLDFYVFEQVCKTLRRWLDSGWHAVTVSVNFSRVHLSNDRFVEQVREMAERYRIPPRLIEIEITETVLFENMHALIGIIKQLKELDFSIAMDDFGSGYSSLTLLKDMPVDVLKLDKSFMNQVSDTERGKIVVSSMIAMAKQLRMQVVAEGVELQEQADFLKKVGCDLIQGYLYGRPMPVPEFEEELAQQVD